MVVTVSARALGHLIAALFFIGATMVSPVTLAQSNPPGDAAPAFKLDWTAPADCPDGDHIRSEVLRLAGTSARSSRQLNARAVIRPDERKSWALALSTDLDGITGERSLSGISCQSLSEAATLTLALILNPEAKIESPPEPVVSPPSPPEVREAWPRPVWQLGALAGLQAGVLKDLSPSFALSLGVALGRFSARLIPGFTPPQKISSQDRPNSGGRLWLVSASALGCFDVAKAWVTLAPCLGVNLVRLQGRGWGVVKPREATVYWTSAEIAVLADLPLGRMVSLQVWGFGLVPLYKSSVYLDEAGRISRPASLGGGALAGFEVAFR